MIFFPQQIEIEVEQVEDEASPQSDGEGGRESTEGGATSLPKWVTGTPQDFASEMSNGSNGLTDKVNRAHLFQYAYQPNLARLVQRKLSSSSSSKIRFLEFGLGCAPGGGMIHGIPGGSALGWRHLFNQIEGIEFELHVFEFDKDCILKWHKQNPDIATQVHTGDASSEEDLLRAYQESGEQPFDVIIDDASHINWHQIKTLDFMLPKLSGDGLFFMEDIQSSCRGWSANMGTHRGSDVGGTKTCMTTNDGKDTILAHVMEYQRHLVGQRDGFKDKMEFLKGVTSIEIHTNIAVLSKEVERV
ncbi:hypothetical protein ACHAXR_007872 [Thalassiosira sp. AJA248-18]